MVLIIIIIINTVSLLAQWHFYVFYSKECPNFEQWLRWPNFFKQIFSGHRRVIQLVIKYMETRFSYDLIIYNDIYKKKAYTVIKYISYTYFN